MVRRRIGVLTAVAALGLGMLGALPASARNNEVIGEPIDAIWHQHRVAFDFHSFNVRYSCRGLQDKMSAILKAVGAHQDLDVALNCPPTGLITGANMLVSVKMPVLASEANVRAETTYSTEQELVARLRRMQLPTANDIERFSAQWQKVALTRNRHLNIDSGDCDLLANMRDQLLPKLGISTNGFRCFSGGTRTRPTFEVAALIAVPPAALVAPETSGVVPTAATVIAAPVALAAEPTISTVN